MDKQHVDQASQVKQGHKRVPNVDQVLPEHHIGGDPDHEAVLQLQRLVGNQATQRLISGGVVQAKMSVSTPGDAYEQEADQVAHDVMTMPDAVQRDDAVPDEDEMLKAQGAAQREEAAVPDEDELLKAQGAAQREEAVPDNDDDEKKLMAKSDGGVPTVMPDVESQIERGRGSGQAMPESAQSFFEPRFGQDFSNVKIHTGEEADGLNQSLQARAFANESDIYFRNGEYQPDTSAGRELLAHELTHVVQQGGSVQKKREDGADA